MKKKIMYLALIGLVLFGLIQLIPFGKDHTNPAVVSEPNWNSPATRQMAKDHCFQCHSNETEWPWYSNVAPASWLLAFDVINGRSRFNFSDWKSSPASAGEMAEVIQSGEMPPIQYTLFHPSSVLNAQQKQDFIQGLQATLGQ
jgi:mono/diheme cytochrome c family protein